MSRALFEVQVGGVNITSALAPILTSMSVSSKAATHADTASLTVDDTGGRIVLPSPKAPVLIYLGWQGGPMREVFSGVVDEVRSSGSRSGGRSLSISAKGLDVTGRAKEGQHRHFDGMTLPAILKAAGELAGITQIEVDPRLASLVLPYVDMRGESFLHLGERLARELGGSFRVQGNRATVAARAGGYTASTVSAAWGVNLISWDLKPFVGRGRHKAARARHYDPKAAREVETSSPTGDASALADFIRRDRAADAEAARRIAGGDAAVASEAGGGGTVVIDGNGGAVPDGLCVLTGARPGADGSYRIKGVTHDYSRSGGWTTSLELAEPQGGAGTDTR